MKKLKGIDLVKLLEEADREHKNGCPHCAVNIPLSWEEFSPCKRKVVNSLANKINKLMKA